MSYKTLGTAAREFGMSLPEAWEDFPWGETALKVRKKVFVFLSVGEEHLSVSMKLPVSAAELLETDFAVPTGYGLGRHGWVSMKITDEVEMTVERLNALIEESYRAVAPKTLSKQIEF